MEEQQLEGLWTYIASEVGGVERSREQVARMGRLVLLPSGYFPGWDGLWAAISFGFQGGTWSESQVKATCRHIILGTDTEGEPPASDFYLWAGGRFRIAPRRSPTEIDFEQYWKGSIFPGSTQLGLYSVDSEQLALCLADSGSPRPTALTSREQPHQSLGRLVRGLNAAADGSLPVLGKYLGSRERDASESVR